jgi:hypothetical protein
MRGAFAGRSIRIAGLVVVLVLVVVGAAMASGVHSKLPKGFGRLAGVPAKTSLHRGLSVAKVKRDSKATSRVIVVLTNQHRRLPATKRRVSSRARAEAADQAPLTAQVASSGGRVTRRYKALNAFAATVSTAEKARLAANPAVYKVFADHVVKLPAAQDASPAVKGAAAPNQGPQTQVCPTDPAKPLLEPEALQTTHAAFNDPSAPSAQQLATGTGVKVAFFADGLDINNPDFIRPDGSHVFIDYKDFSGDGPNAPTGAAEAFGDASSIAAQGRQTYDLANFVNPAHPLPPGCNIRVLGMAPGASLIGMKVFGNSSFTFDSQVLQGLDWAVTHDHPDILSESFGENPLPDTAQDLTRAFNEQAVAAGITVVESTGDAGVESTIGSAATDPAVISAGAATNFRGYAQATAYGFQFGNGSFLSDNISSIGSAGYTQDGRVLDLVAPGETGWALCSTDVAIYEECADFKGAPAAIQQFGGTSESAPLIAGAVALVDQAYRDTHGGATPSPALVKRLLTSTATDLGFPSFEQGAGELNSLAAVQAARSISTPDGSPSATGNNLVVDKTQLDITGQAGSATTTNVAVTNTGTSTQIVRAHARALGSTLADQTKTVNLGSTPTFVDQFGAARPYVQTTFTVPAGADRLVAYDTWPGPNARVGLALIDPHGSYAAYTRPQGDGNHGEVDVHAPVAGTWTAIVFLRDGSFTGPVHLDFQSQKYTTVDSVTPSALTLAPGKTGHLQLHATLPQSAGDFNQDLELDGSGGTQNIVPIALRSLVKLNNNGGAFSGTLIGGNGRAAAPAQQNTFDFDVPAGKPEIGVTLTFADDVGTSLTAVLVDPTGQTTSTDVTDANNALQAYRANPRAGRWRFVVFTNQPVGGNALTAPFTGHVTFAAPKATVTGLPNNASKQLKAGKATTATVTVRNDGPATESLFLDPRLNARADFSLLALTPDQNIALPIAVTEDATVPEYIVPTQTNMLTAAAQGSEPVTFDWAFGSGDPHLAATNSGNTAAGQFSAGEVPPGVWDIAPDLVGPFDGPATPGTVSTGIVAHTRRFDLDASPDNGDFEQLKVDPNAPGVRFVNVAPGKRGTLTLTITPSGRAGRTVSGTLYVDAFSNSLGFTSELLAIPYEYTVG